ncbi:LysR substrate-binding domain-containing protein [Parasutterella secunda]|uniref:LysR substrate-binding domain-containing protein n=1 Tax=Parasutterella secunda TaxID=626947 RepID=UPI0025A47C94|nr:LysR substrate-binding domain-containing protein [Parasutterella secunda]MDM8112862.1 LysR substrate-binding domain-containing protein [Parasutterella secunda]
MAQNIIDAHDQLVILGGTQNQTLQGPIRCGLPPSFFDRLLLRYYLDFNKKYPGIQIQTQDFRKPAPIEFYQKGNMLDLVIGYGPDPEMDRAFQYRLGECLRIPVASLAYLEKYGTPKKLSDLKNHILLDRDNALIYTGDYFVDTGEHNIVLRFAKKISFSSPTSLKEAALLGGGIHHGIPVIYCYKELERGDLVALPGLWKFQPLDYYLFIRKESAELQRVQVFKQFLLDSLKEEFQQCGDLCKKLGLK